MVALSLAVFLASQTTGTVSYGGEAIHVGAVLQEVSKSAGIHLEADPEADREIVLISVKDMPLQVFLDRLASVTSCSWDKSDSKWVLKPSARLRAKEADDEFQAKASGIAKQIQTEIEASKKRSDVMNVKTEPGQAAISALAEANNSDPGTAALNQILSRMDPTALAAIGPGERGVWATNSANSMQKLLPEGSGALITDWIQQHNAMVAKSKPDIQDSVTAGLPKEMLDMFRSQTQAVTKAPTKALLVVKQSTFMGSWLGLQVELAAYDAQGTSLIQTQTMLDSQMAEMMARIAAPKKPATAGSETPIPYSDDSKALKQVFGAASGNGFTVNVPPQLRAKLLHPETKDPLAYLATDRLMALAKKKEEQIIADLPDSSFGLDFADSGEVTTVEAEQRDLDSKKTLIAVLDGNCLLVRPAKPDAERHVRINRASLATLLAAVEAKRQPSLDDVCAYALANEPPFSNPIGMTYCMTFVPSLMGFSLSGSFPDWNMYRLYGSLSPVQQQSLRSGGRVSLSELSEGQRGYAAAVLFGADATFRPADKKPGGTDLLTRMSSMFGGSSSNGAMDPTELMPNGLSPGIVMTCAASDEPIMQTLDATGKPGTWCFSASDLAMVDLMKSMPGAQNMDSMFPTNGLLGHRTDLEFTFHVGSLAALDQTLRDDVVGADAQHVSLNSLPADFQALVEKQKADLKHSPLGMFQSMPMFRNTPPP